jgi:TolA-binding protein
MARAVDGYRSLRARCPRSEEARSAVISLGELLLRLGDGPGALAAFDAYLAESPDGALTEEALFGRARSLRALGRLEDERGTWRGLVGRFPGSAYRSAAARRLSELER